MVPAPISLMRVRNTVSVVNTATNSVAATVGVGWLPVDAAVTPDRSNVYVNKRRIVQRLVDRHRDLRRNREKCRSGGTPFRRRP